MFDFGLYTQVSDSGPWALLFGHAPAGKANIGPSMMAGRDSNTIKHMYSATFLFINFIVIAFKHAMVIPSLQRYLLYS